MSHVFVLEATDSRVPRWFTEGLAVYEETAGAPDWGDRLDPEAIHAIQKKLLLPVAELDRGFIRPTYPSQVIVSYFQGGKICSYIAEKWGYSKLLDMIQSFAKLESTPEVFQKDLGISTTDFDKQFLAWLDAQTKVTTDHFDEWREKLKMMVADERSKDYGAVIQIGNAIRDWYPDYVEVGSVYELLADAYTAKGDKDNARKQLEKYNEVGGRDPKLVERLATLEEEAGQPQKAAAALDRLNYIYPEDQELHKRLGDLWLAQNNVPGAIREYQALLALKPLDQATSHYQLAEALRKANRLDQARDEVLLALEAAPGFKPAQKLLLRDCEIIKHVHPNHSDRDSAELKERIDRFQEVQRSIVREVRKIIVGQDEVIEQVMISLFVGGHCLITGLPGTAKTLLVRTLAQTLGLVFKRIQFTPDLMPSDITGTDIIEEEPGTGRRTWTFVPGRFFPTSCWRTKSTARLPRRSRRCWKPCRSCLAPCAGINTRSRRRSLFWPRRTPSNWKAPIRCLKRSSTASCSTPCSIICRPTTK